MAPFYREGTYCFCRRAQVDKLQIGDVVIANLTAIGLVIKRIESIDDESKSLRLRGDNPASISSEKMGLVPYEAILYRVIWPRKAGV